MNYCFINLFCFEYRKCDSGHVPDWLLVFTIDQVDRKTYIFNEMFVFYFENKLCGAIIIYYNSMYIESRLDQAAIWLFVLATSSVKVSIIHSD